MGVHGIDLGTTYSCVAMLDEHGNPLQRPQKDPEPDDTKQQTAPQTNGEGTKDED